MTVTEDISVSQASSVLGDRLHFGRRGDGCRGDYAGNAEVNGAASITTNGGAVDLSFADADSLLNGNGTAPAQTGSVAADVTVTGTISVAEVADVIGANYIVEGVREQLLSGSGTALGVADAQEIIVDGIINQAQYETLLDTGSR